MIISLIIVGVACLALVSLLLFARGSGPRNCSVEHLTQHSLPVDLESFRNLVDPAEEEFLRTSLPAAEFRTLQRRRSRAALEYVTRTAHNAAILLRVGQAARRNSNSETSRAAEHLVNSALRLRIYSLFAMSVFCARIAFPGARIRVSGFIDLYEQTRDSMTSLARFQFPAQASRITSSI